MTENARVKTMARMMSGRRNKRPLSLPVSPMAIAVVRSPPPWSGALAGLLTWLSLPCRLGHDFKQIDSDHICCSNCFRLWKEEK